MWRQKDRRRERQYRNIHGENSKQASYHEHYSTSGVILLSKSVTNTPSKQINAEMVQGKCRNITEEMQVLRSVCSVAEKMVLKSTPFFSLPSFFLLHHSLFCIMHLFCKLPFDCILTQLIKKEILLWVIHGETTSSLHLAFWLSKSASSYNSYRLLDCNRHCLNVCVCPINWRECSYQQCL